MKNLKKEINNITVYPDRKGEYMQIKLSSPGESFAAMTILVMHADGKASIKELNYILKNYCSQPLRILDAIDDGDKFNVFLETENKIFKSFKRNPSANEIKAFSDYETEKIIEAAKDLLKPDLRETAFLLATELAHADGLTDNEKSILEQIKNDFEIDNEVAAMIREVVSIKYREPDALQNNIPMKLPIQFQSVAEALIAIELAVIFADEDVSTIQTSNMFWNLTLLNIFKDKSPEYFNETKYKILNMFDKHLDKPESFNAKDIDNLILACKSIMGPKIRETALWVAFELAYATGFNNSEKAFIEHFIHRMDIDNTVAEKIGIVVPIKFRV